MRTWLLVVFLWPAALFARGPFDGTWMAKLETVRLPSKPVVYLLQKGTYTCTSCVPRAEVKADGADHPIAGSPYFDTVSVQVVDEHDLRITEKLAGRTVYTEDDTVSADGNTLVEQMTDFAAPSGEAVTAEETFSRVSPGPDGAGVISGSWQAEKVKAASPTALTVVYRSIPGGLQASTPKGEGYAAKFDGKDYPIQGDPAHETVSLKWINARTLEETDKQDGAVHYRLRLAVSRDGQTMQVTEHDQERGTRMSYTMEKKGQ